MTLDTDAEQFSDKGLVTEIAGTMVGFLCEEELPPSGSEEGMVWCD